MSYELNISETMSTEDRRLLRLLIEQHLDTQPDKKRILQPHQEHIFYKSKKYRPKLFDFSLEFHIRDGMEIKTIRLSHSIFKKEDFYFVTDGTLDKGGFAKVRNINLVLTKSKENPDNLHIQKKELLLKAMERSPQKAPTFSEMQNEATLFKKIHRKKGPCFFGLRTGPSQYFDKSYILMPRFPGIKLKEFLKKEPLNSKERYLLATLCALALKEIHQKNMIHRDIKSDNIIVYRHYDTWIVNIADFGLAREKDRPDSLGCGTPKYTAPEMGTNPKDANESADIFSLFITYCDIFKITLGRESALSFQITDPSLYTLTKENKKILIDNTDDIEVANHLLYLFEKMSATDPTQRPSINTVCKELLKKMSFLEENHQNIIFISQINNDIPDDAEEKLESAINKINTVGKDFSREKKRITTELLQKLKECKDSLTDIKNEPLPQQKTQKYAEFYKKIESITLDEKKYNALNDSIGQILTELLNTLTRPLSYVLGGLDILITKNHDVWNHGLFCKPPQKTTGGKVKAALEEARNIPRTLTIS